MNTLIEFMKEREEKAKVVKTKEYLNWLVDCLTRRETHRYADEDALYDDNKIDSENGKLLSYFISYVDEIAQEQRVLNVTDPENEFETMNYVININDVFIDIGLMVGQGAITYCSLCKKPNYCYVNLNK